MTPPVSLGQQIAASSALEAMIAHLDLAAERADPCRMHWIGDGDAGPDYCLSCCEKAVAYSRASGEYPDAFVDGGWDDERTSDHPAYCEDCGCLLGYNLSSYGLTEEIAHWFENAGLPPFTADDAYELRATLSAALALQLHILRGSESMGNHDSGSDDGWGAD